MMPSHSLAAFILVLLMLSTLGTAVPLSSFYTYGATAGDIVLDRNDDGFSQQISSPSSFPFFGKSYRILYVNNNGIVSLNSSYTAFTPAAFPFSSNGPIIAAFFADVDTTGSGGGYVTYRITTDATLLAKAVHDIPPILSGPNFVPVWLLIATWDHVGYFSSHYDKTNTFQCILATDGTQTFTIFQYADGLIQWTTGDANNGVNGLGGIQAQVGFNAGDAVNYFNVPESRTSAIINIAQTSNVNVSGQWIFQVQNRIISPDVPAPLNFFLSSVPGSSNTLRAIWSAPVLVSGSITAYKVYCSISDSQAYPEQVVGPNQPTIRSTVNGTTLTSVFNTGLNPFTQYNCYVTASISLNEGLPSSVAANRTDESTPSAPRNVSLSTVPYFPNLLTATWTSPMLKNGIITAYTVYCSSSVNGRVIETVTNATTLAATINIGSVMFALYSCYVTANTSIGEGIPSQTITIESLSVPESPLNVSLTPIPGSPNQLLASWTPPAQSSSGIVAYTVYCNTSATQEYDEQVIGINVPTIRAVVNGTTLAAIFDTNLNPYTQYDCYVTANTSAGEGTASNIMTARTSESVPGPVVGLKRLVNTFTTITLLWQQPRISNGIIVAYSISIQSTLPFINSTTKRTVYTVLDLTAGTLYNFSVAACTSKGCGDPVYLQSSTQSIGNISCASIVAINNSAVRVSWNPLLLPSDGALVGYTVFHWQSELKATRIPDGATQVEINNLSFNNNNSYEFTIMAEISINGQPQIVNISRHLYLKPIASDSTALTDDSSFSTIKALSAILAIVIALFLILLVVAIVLAALTVRKNKRSDYVVAIVNKEDSHDMKETALTAEHLMKVM